MQTTNPAENGYTDDQWVSLLNQTFGDPPSVEFSVDPPSPRPEPTDEIDSVTPVAIPKKTLRKKVWIVITALLSVIIAVLCVFLFSPSTHDNEQTQCMEALQLWQSTPYYQMDTYTYQHTSTKDPFTNSGHDSYIYGPPVESSVSTVVSVYYHGDNCKLILNHEINGGNNENTGRAQYYDKWCTYYNVSINFYQWQLTTDSTPIPLPWIQSFSFDNVEVLSQQVVQTEGNSKIVSFAVKDTDPSAEFYGQDPYQVQFLFNESGWLYGVMRYQSDSQSKKSTTTAFYLKETSADLVERKVATQIYTAFSGFITDSYPQPIIHTSPPA